MVHHSTEKRRAGRADAVLARVADGERLRAADGGGAGRPARGGARGARGRGAGARRAPVCEMVHH